MANWKPIESAPKDGTVVVLKTLGGFVLLGSWTNGLIGSNEKPAGGWGAEEKHPPCWTDGICWEVNENLERSDPPTHWKPVHLPPSPH